MDQQQETKVRGDVITYYICLFVTRGPGDSNLLCGPTTIIEGKERFDSKGREKARKAQTLQLETEKARTKSAS